MSERSVAWRRREPPLPPAAVVARGAAIDGLLKSLARRPAAERTSLRAIAFADLLLVAGPEEQLPWSDGALYLGRAPDARRLLLPTRLEPDLPIELFERALRRRLFASAAGVTGAATPTTTPRDGLLAILPGDGAAAPLALPLDEARTLGDDTLQALRDLLDRGAA